MQPHPVTKNRHNMIEYLRGEVTELSPTTAIIECAGVGYETSITLNTYSVLQNKKEVKVYIYEIIREDTHQLFAFHSKEERELFLRLVSVSGIGGNTARTILSAFTVAELCDVIASGNEQILKSVKGIGLKTAQRIIVELKDKIQNLSGKTENSTIGMTSATNETADSAIAALVMLGFPSAAASKVVQSVIKTRPDATVEQVIKLSLKQL